MRSDNYKVKLNMEELFPPAWYENVTNAANYALHNMNIPEEKMDDLVMHIIDYNINKQLNDKLLNSITDDLPSYLSFVDNSATKVFNEFKGILDACDICPSFKEHVMYIQLGNSERDKKTFKFWKELAKKDFKSLSLTTRELKEQECIKLTIRKKWYV